MNNSDFEIDLYDSVFNNGLGRSHLLKKKKDKNGYDVFLFYCERHNWHFVLCDALYGTKDGCSFSRTAYHSEIEAALKAFNNA